MCTVTYIPNSSGGFILTSNRDESIIRPVALMPQVYDIFNQRLLFPKDPKAGGTWIAAGKNRAACLLNGAFKKHTPKPSYRKSRGLVLLDYFSFDTVHSFINQYDFHSIEPFTLILIESKKIIELRWDEEQLFFTEKDSTSSHIWSSTTLYSDEIIEKRKQWFSKWITETTSSTLDSIVNFHLDAGDGDTENDIFMNRKNGIRTVSITSIAYNLNSYEMIHRDVLNNGIEKSLF